jgi:hypothetical protein
MKEPTPINTARSKTPAQDAGSKWVNELLDLIESAPAFVGPTGELKRAIAGLVLDHLKRERLKGSAS